MMTRTSSAFALENRDDSDADTIQQVLDGNTAMFELLMRRYNERVYRAARSIVRDEQEAEDVMHQAYVDDERSCSVTWRLFLPHRSSRPARQLSTALAGSSRAGNVL